MIILGCPTKHRGKTWWHLASTESLEELERFAHEIGLPQEWFQPKSRPHYDVTGRYLTKALSHGAVKVKRNEFVEKAAR